METLKPQIYLTAGHNNKDSGAVGNGYKEAELTKELRDLIKKALHDFNVACITDEDDWSLSKTILELSAKSLENDVLLDIHFNASENPTATGTEVIVPQGYNTRELTLARTLVNATSAAISVRNRGVIDESRSDRGHLGMMRLRGANLILEVCFITNKMDMARYQASKEGLAYNIAGHLAGFIKY